MCGICGIVDPTNGPIDLDILQSMTRVMRHRGPDDEGYYRADGVGLGFQRLSIIDLAGGRQPLANEDGRLQLVFNGEIYNFQSLRKDLESTGRHRFKTQSDTEVILHLYEDHREHCVDFLRGMFSFAIWDTRERSLFLARDRFGKKPLFYTQAGGSFLFASELRALLRHPAVKKTVDPAALDLYLTYQYIPSPHTIFQGIHKLPPAHTLLWKAGQIQIARYWDLPFSPKTSLSFPEAKMRLMSTLREATALRLYSDVSMGAFLSGGIDSATVVGMMSEASTQPVKTFSIGFEEETFSELPYAKIVARRFGTDHHELIVKPDAAEMIPRLVQHFGEPFADSSALPSAYLAAFTHEHVKVSLSGDGGDEAFAGYARYQAAAFFRYWDLLPAPLRRSLAAAMKHLPLPHRISRLIELGGDGDAGRYLQLIRLLRREQKDALYTPAFRGALEEKSADDFLPRSMAGTEHLLGIDRWLAADVRTYLPECLMTKVDVTSMAYSLEVRSPFMDQSVMELAASFPPSWKWNGLSRGKYILTEAVRGWLPDEILRRPKMGFGLPIGRWFRGPLKPLLEESLFSNRARQRNLFQPDAIRRLFTEHMDAKTDHGYRLWALLMLEQWYRAFMD